MKKILLVPALFLFLAFASFIAFPREAFAVPPNSFECVPVGRAARCQPNTGTDTCSPGYEPNDSVCSPYHGNPDMCRRAGGACLSPVTPSGMEGFNVSELEKVVGNKLNLRFVSGNLGDIVGALLPYLFAGAGILLLLYLLYGGISLMLSGGDPKAIQSAKDKITGALVGFIIVFASYWLVQIVGKILGITAIQDIFK